MRLPTLLALFALFAAATPSTAHPTASADKITSAGGEISFPTTLNFCGGDQVDLNVMFCNPTTANITYSARLVESSPAYDCNQAIVPDHIQHLSSVTVAPGQCDTFPFTLFRPAELDQDASVCYWVRAGVQGNENAWLGARLIDSPLACIDFTEVEGALWMHPLTPVAFEFVLRNDGPFGYDISYELWALDPKGETPQNNLAFNGGDPAEGFFGSVYLEPGQSTRVNVDVEWTDPEAAGFHEISFRAPTFDKGGYPISEIASLPVGLAPTTPTAVDPAPSPADGWSLYPNPFNPRTTISFGMPRAGRATVEVLDARGRGVRTLLAADLSAGDHEVVWDGTTDGGERAASGLYMVRVTTPDGSSTRKGILIK